MSKLLITDGRSRATLVMSKFLNKEGIDITVGEERYFCSSFFSKYVNNRLIYPSIDKKNDAFVKYLYDKVKKEKYDAIFPVRDPATLTISKYRNKFEKYTNVPVGEYKKLIMANNKAKIIEISKKAGIPHPKTYFEKKNKITNIEDEVIYPVLIKPCMGSGSRGMFYAKNKKELSKGYKNARVFNKEVMIQEYIPHRSRDQFMVASLFNMESEPRGTFVLRKIREYPNSGGPMTFAESVNIPTLVKQNEKLLKEMKWKGMAAVEYIYDKRDKKYKIIEINARFYGGLGTALYSGMNFPKMLFEIATKGDTKTNRKYKKGIKWRWLWPGDILAFMNNPYKRDLLNDFLDFKNNNFAILSLKDPGPTIGATLDAIHGLKHKERRDHVFNRGWNRYKKP